MDIYCPKCGEPWDIDELHGMETLNGLKVPFKKAVKIFAKHGCGAFYTQCGDLNEERAAKSKMLFEAFGNDVDGIAAMMEDLNG